MKKRVEKRIKLGKERRKIGERREREISNFQPVIIKNTIKR